MRRIEHTIIFVMVFLLSSCADFSSETPPFAITVPTCSTNANFDFTYAGISFYLLNKSHKSISSITAHFMLFDARTQTNPFIGSNIFEIKKFILISPGENKEIILSLDRFIYIAPEEPYLIDFFYISKIEYSDGSIWEDKYGVYGMRQEK